MRRIYKILLILISILAIIITGCNNNWLLKLYYSTHKKQLLDFTALCEPMSGKYSFVYIAITENLCDHSDSHKKNIWVLEDNTSSSNYFSLCYNTQTHQVNFDSEYFSFDSTAKFSKLSIKLKEDTLLRNVLLKYQEYRIKEVMIRPFGVFFVTKIPTLSIYSEAQVGIFVLYKNSKDPGINTKRNNIGERSFIFN